MDKHTKPEKKPDISKDKPAKPGNKAVELNERDLAKVAGGAGGGGGAGKVSHT